MFKLARLFFYLLTILLLFIVALLKAQTIQNVQRLSTTFFSAVAGEDFIVADAWGFTDEGREFAIVPRTEGGVAIVDVSTPTNPVIASSLPIPAGGHRLYHAKYYDGYIYAVMRPGPLQIIDAHDPYNAQVVNEYANGFSEAYVIFIADTVAYMADVTSTRTNVNLIALDISDPLNPVELGTWYRTYHHIFVRNDTLVGFVQKGEIDFLDVSDPSNIQLIYTITNTGDKTHSGWLNDRGDILSVDHETIGGHLALWNIDPLNTASMISEYSTATNTIGETSLHHSRWYFDLIYMSYWLDGLRVLDASDLNNLNEVAVYDTIQPNPSTMYRGFWGCFPYLPSRNILVSDPQTGLIVLDYVNDGPGIFTNPLDSIRLLGQRLRGEFNQINGSSIDTASSYVYYRFNGQSSWQNSSIKPQGRQDSFFFEINFPPDLRYLDYYLQLQDVNGQKTRAPGLAPFLDFTRVRVQNSGGSIPEIFISEISDGNIATNAFLEIYNASQKTVDLSQAKIVRCLPGSDGRFNSGAYVFDFGGDESFMLYSTTVPAGGFLLVANGSDQTTFESEWGPLPENVHFNPGTSDLQLGTGSGTRWALIQGGNVNRYDGVVIDQTPSNVGGTGQYAYQISSGNWSVSTSASNATPGYLAADQSLPVVLLSFSGRYDGSAVELTWQTASEVNNHGFVILKKENGDAEYRPAASFETASELKGAGHSSTGRHYRYQDAEVLVHRTYRYILESVSFNGRIQRLDSIEVRTERGEIIISSPLMVRCYPNPFNGKTRISVTFNDKTDQLCELKIFDLNGRCVKTFSPSAALSSPMQFVWDGRDNAYSLLATGLYFLKVRSAKTEKTVKLLLMR
ncbi:choice-of-anchor B family protein [Caldithrix abyssi]